MLWKFIKPPRARELNLLKESSISHIEEKRKHDLNHETD